MRMFVLLYYHYYRISFEEDSSPFFPFTLTHHTSSSRITSPRPSPSILIASVVSSPHHRLVTHSTPVNRQQTIRDEATNKRTSESFQLDLTFSSLLLLSLLLSTMSKTGPYSGRVSLPHRPKPIHQKEKGQTKKEWLKEVDDWECIKTRATKLFEKDRERSKDTSDATAEEIEHFSLSWQN